MKKRIIAIALVGICLCSSLLIAETLQDADPVSALATRMDRMETRMDNNLWTMLLSAGGVILVMLGGFFTLRKSILNEVRKDIETKAKKVVETEVPPMVTEYGKKTVQTEFEAINSVVVKMADEIGFERIARTKFSILIIAVDEGDAWLVKDLLGRMGFDKEMIQTQKMMAYPGIKTDAYDLVIFEDLGFGNEITISEVQNYVTRREKSTFIYHGPSRELKFEPRNIHLNFANSWFTLYPRIMETLRYLHFSKENT